MTDAREHAVRVGAEDRLLGIVTMPARPRPDAPACLLMNAGVVHRIGPHRLNVKIARTLAADGFTSLRVDLSGLGDSKAASGAFHSGEQTLHDLRDAMTHLEQTLGVSKFVVFGLCSGSVNGFRLALTDERIVGLLMFDGHAYSTLKMHLRRRWARFKSSPWRVLALKPLQWLLPRVEKPGQNSDDSHLAVPPRAEFARAMNALTARGTAVYLYFSASFIESYNYREQMLDAFRGAPFVDRIRCDYEKDVDHTVTSIDAQRKVVAAIRDWFQSVFGPSSGSST